MPVQKYRSLQIKLTPQRLAILSYLNGNKTHPSAEDIYKAVQKQYPTMSFATVYNTLEALRDKGNIRELKIDPAKKRYDPDNTPHHHLICVKCNCIVDIHEDFDLNLPGKLTRGFDLIGKSIEFYGICRKCK
ncbi:MAG: transcriptional repressor [Nitrospirae bacterium]|nr:transcriptional repressor [Nitrospirota bacterium]